MSLHLLIQGLVDDESTLKTLVKSKLYDRNVIRIVLAFQISQSKPQHITSRLLETPRIKNIFAPRDPEVHTENGEDIVFFAVVTTTDTIHLYNRQLRVVDVYNLPPHTHSFAVSNDYFLLFNRNTFYISDYAREIIKIRFPELSKKPVYYLDENIDNFAVVNDDQIDLYFAPLYSPRVPQKRAETKALSNTEKILPCNNFADATYMARQNIKDGILYLKKKDFVSYPHVKYLDIKENNFIIAQDYVISWNNGAVSFSVSKLKD